MVIPIVVPVSVARSRSLMRTTVGCRSAAVVAVVGIVAANYVVVADAAAADGHG